jgi:hypothetical protein
VGKSCKIIASRRRGVDEVVGEQRVANEGHKDEMNSELLWSKTNLPQSWKAERRIKKIENNKSPKMMSRKASGVGENLNRKGFQRWWHEKCFLK